MQRVTELEQALRDAQAARQAAEEDADGAAAAAREAIAGQHQLASLQVRLFH